MLSSHIAKEIAIKVAVGYCVFLEVGYGTKNYTKRCD
jgi:hypothetical protein